MATAYLQRLRTRLCTGGLSAREHQVLMCVTAGLSYKEIASQLRLEVGTVRTLIVRAYKKLGVKSRA